MSVLVVADTVGAELSVQTYELISAAQSFHEPVMLAVLGERATEIAQGASVSGVDTIIAVALPCAEFEPDTWCDALTALIKDRTPQVTLLSFTVNSTAVGGAVAARLGLGFAADVIALQVDPQGLSVTRPQHGGKVHAALDFPEHDQVLLMLRAGAWPATSDSSGNDRPGNASVEHFTVVEPRRRVRHLGFEAPEDEDVDLANAERILCLGRGIGDGKVVPRFEQLADQLGATLAASRPVVDRGWLPRSRQIGQSGVTVGSRVYLALGVSGAPQHLAGILNCDVVIAVNADPAAPIFDIAHYGAVADLFEVATELERQL